MAHASDIKACYDMYLKHLNRDKVWKKHIEFLYTRNTKDNRLTNCLYGRLCFSQQLRFFVLLNIDQNGYIAARFWREDKEEIGKAFCDSHFEMKLLAALAMFPEMEEIEFNKSSEKGWCTKNIEIETVEG